MGFWRFDWWRDENNREGASSLASVLKIVIPALIVAAIAVAGWFGLDLGGTSSPKPSIQTGDNSIVQTGDGIQVSAGDNAAITIHQGISPQDFLKALNQRETQVRAELNGAHAEDRALLEAQLGEINRQKSDLEAAYTELQAQLERYKAQLAELRGKVPDDELTVALARLEAGDRRPADTLLSDVQALGAGDPKTAAAAAYAQGEIARVEIRWKDAAQHYARAAELDPSLKHLKKAREFAYLSGDYDAAFKLGEQLVQAAQDLGPAQEHAYALTLHGATLTTVGSFSQAEAHHRRALEIYASAGIENDQRVASAQNNLALSLKAQGRFDEAETLMRRVVEIDRTTINADSQRHAAHLGNLAGVLRKLGRYPEAETLYRQALVIDGKTLGVSHPDYASRLGELAKAVMRQGRLVDAEALMRQALETLGTSLGEVHPEYATQLNNLASVVMDLGRYSESEEMLRKGLEIHKLTIGEDHYEHAHTLGNLAVVLKYQEKYEEVEDLDRRAMEITRKVKGENHPDYAVSLNNLATTYEFQGKFDEAHASFTEAFRVAENAFAEGHPTLDIIRGNYERFEAEHAKRQAGTD